MGRIKTRFVKAAGEKIYKINKDDFTTDFAKNKEIIEKYAQIPSKRLKNIVAGYITRLAKRSED